MKKLTANRKGLKISANFRIDSNFLTVEADRLLGYSGEVTPEVEAYHREISSALEETLSELNQLKRIIDNLFSDV